MRYQINHRLKYDTADCTLTLAGSNEPDIQLSMTASTLLVFFLHNTQMVSREEVLTKVWDDNGLTSSNSNLNQYLSMLRKTFRRYDIDNIIVTVSRGMLQLNPDLHIEILDAGNASPGDQPQQQTPAAAHIRERTGETTPYTFATCSYVAGACMLTCALLLVIFGVTAGRVPQPISLTKIVHHECRLLAGERMLHSVSPGTYVSNFDTVRQRLKLACKPDERFLFFYGDRLETDGLGRVFIAHCAVHEDNPFSYCDNYFYYSWKP